MRFTPTNYTVSYKGVFHKPGDTFDIDPQDAAEMAKHGKVEEKPAGRAARKKGG